MVKISICGKANSGKNTLAKMIVNQIRKQNTNNFYMSATYLAFADPIKEMAQIMFPRLPTKFLYGPSGFRSALIPGAYKNKCTISVRQFLIDLGTEFGRGYNENIWLNNFDCRFNKTKAKIVIVPDVRRINEFEHLKNKGFYQIKLYRNTGQSGINHISETDQNNIPDSAFDYVIHNNKTLTHLRSEIAVNIIPQLKF
jgi:hypothetical protein